MKCISQLISICLFCMPIALAAQSVAISDFDREDTRDMNFEIIGKMNSNILVYKNIRSNHKISIFDREMNTVETVKLNFVPDKTFNIDFVAYPDYFLMIYQYQKGTILHCMAVKMDAKAQKMNEPVEIDTTRIPVMSDNKIYSTVYSEDRKKIVIFKIQTRNQKFNMQTLLYDNEMNLISKNRMLAEYNDRKDNYDNFMVGNDGSFVFTYARQSGNRDNSNALSLIIKSPQQQTYSAREIDLKERYIDEIKLKIDNRNNRYLLNTFYYRKNRGSIEGLFTYIFDKEADKTYASQFTEITDSLRYEAKSGGMLRFALDNFFIRQIVVKGDGGFVLTAEDYSADTRNNNNFNRYDYLYNPYSLSPGYYYYNPYRGYYRPVSRLNNQTTRYYYENILVMSISKTGQMQWSKVLHKSQFDDEEENFMSFSTITSGNEIHFLFNDDRKYQVISDQAIASDGSVKRYPTLKSPQKGYEFMPSLSKQTGANQIIIPCAYRNNICFARVDF
ncbi:MAG: hypothetical protein JNM14_11735 [Ferruginibacter sp.]|nr:hypothetical protein [Ferruginibacter sp.]